MNIKVAAFTVSEKFINNLVVFQHVLIMKNVPAALLTCVTERCVPVTQELFAESTHAGAVV